MLKSNEFGDEKFTRQVNVRMRPSTARWIPRLCQLDGKTIQELFDRLVAEDYEQFVAENAEQMIAEQRVKADEHLAEIAFIETIVAEQKAQ